MRDRTIFDYFWGANRHEISSYESVFISSESPLLLQAAKQRGRYLVGLQGFVPIMCNGIPKRLAQETLGKQAGVDMITSATNGRGSLSSIKLSASLMQALQ